ncbi:MAG: hypothetical protein JRN58_00050 [Nitrososphaerota archaeon]|nr:hypothetical protein [Nitrososphaerota archaeon]
MERREGEKRGEAPEDSDEKLEAYQKEMKEKYLEAQAEGKEPTGQEERLKERDEQAAGTRDADGSWHESSPAGAGKGEGAAEDQSEGPQGEGKRDRSTGESGEPEGAAERPFEKADVDVELESMQKAFHEKYSSEGKEGQQESGAESGLDKEEADKAGVSGSGLDQREGTTSTQHSGAEAVPERYFKGGDAQEDVGWNGAGPANHEGADKEEPDEPLTSATKADALQAGDNGGDPKPLRVEPSRELGSKPPSPAPEEETFTMDGPGSREPRSDEAPRVDARAYYISSTEKTRLDVDKSALEEAIGESLRDGDMFRIGGSVEGTQTSFEARLSGTKGDHVSVFLDGRSEEVVPSENYKLRIEHFERDRTFEVAHGRRGPSINIYETVLESLGVPRDGPDCVVEFHARTSKDGEEKRVYSTYHSAVGWMQIPVGGIGARAGDRIEVASARRFELTDAVAAFNQQKPDSLKNVGVTLDKEKLSLQVDGQRFEAKEPRLTSHGGQAALKVKIGEENIKFQFDGKTVTPRLERNSDRIREFKTIYDGLYAIREHSKSHTHLHQIVPDRISSMSYDELRRWSTNKIRLAQIEDKVEGEHQLEVTSDFQHAIHRRLVYAGTRYSTEKGNVGEILATKLFQSIGFEVVKDHPNYEGDESRGSSRSGPECVVRSGATGSIYYIEVKN